MIQEFVSHLGRDCASVAVVCAYVWVIHVKYIHDLCSLLGHILYIW
jgi:hypothetical protein